MAFFASPTQKGGEVDLFAGKMHALLCRKWKNQVKGRDWYDLVWSAAHHPHLHLAHLEQRMRQTGHWQGMKGLDRTAFYQLCDKTVEQLSVEQARNEVEPFVPNAETLPIWSAEFFRDMCRRIVLV